MKEEDESTIPSSPSEDPTTSGFTAMNDDLESTAPEGKGEEGSETSKRRKRRIPRLYPCSRKDLYPTCTLMWTSCQENLPAFTDFSPSYDEDLMTDMFGLIVTVQAMPDETERTEPHRTAHDQAEKTCMAYCTQWQRLKRYIIRAKFSLLDAKLDVAGQKLYETAFDFNWSDAQALVLTADKFIASHLEELTANRNMPPTFPAKLTALGVTFNKDLADFRGFEIVTEGLTDQKMIAENDLYLKAIEMGMDGQEVFKKDLAKARLFSFSAMLETVSGVGSASLAGTVTDEDNAKKALANVSITIVEKEISVLTSKQGKYKVNRLASGSYTVKVEAPGYLPVTLTDVTLQPGTAKRANVKLKKM